MGSISEVCYKTAMITTTVIFVVLFWIGAVVKIHDLLRNLPIW